MRILATKDGDQDMVAWDEEESGAVRSARRGLGITTGSRTLFQRVSLDAVHIKAGRLKYLIVARDNLSGWPEATPLVNLTAEAYVDPQVQGSKESNHRWRAEFREGFQATLDGTRMARSFAVAHIKRFYSQGDRSKDQEEEEVRSGRVVEAEPGSGGRDWVMKFLPGVQKSGQIFDSCPGSRTMQGGVRRKDMDGAGEWYGRVTGVWWWKEELDGDDGDIIRAVEGCGGRFGKGRQGKGGAESAPGMLKEGFCWILLGFEEEGVAVEGNRWCHQKEGQKLGRGVHQGQSGWSKTAGATDL
ncbi:hypothetical protein PPACK8108_LOCUS11866 [Phakopsora pachyrhizi]|uniref:Uncharacterized protein n=1 Tax=Phakopsora pachyrhizi TaxID=170000 RepID=A0AAV0B2U4_PHAPC|nr:hypothetical protein PPACK8108_LOCUS11866 [Phakopsora pachyrhizi]